MAGNTFGNLLKLSTFGESHGVALGGVLDGVPAGIEVDFEAINIDLARRKPGQSRITTQRKEDDEVEFLSGIFEGKTTGTSIGFIIKNKNQRSNDYGDIAKAYRPSHADFTYDQKFGFRDYRGGGRSSARETAVRVVAGAIAKQIIPDIKINAYVSGVGELKLDIPYNKVDFNEVEKNPVRCPDQVMAEKMVSLIEEVKLDGNTVGGVVSCVISGTPIGLGEPVFDRLQAELAKAMFSINAVKGFEYGSGFEGSKMKGSEHNDLFNQNGTTKTNRSGGIQGGISNGEQIYFNVAFKPVATLLQPQETINQNFEMLTLNPKGRHDPCVVPRAVPIVESMAALVIADYYLINKTRKI
ncbi:MAG: chorismate synthase [Ichthyobacteriaceae bacterium]|nr:chorismate synthase [Ichthyobacteriaceae bacterium]